MQEVFTWVIAEVVMKREPEPLSFDFICEFLHVRFAIAEFKELDNLPMGTDADTRHFHHHLKIEKGENPLYCGNGNIVFNGNAARTAVRAALYLIGFCVEPPVALVAEASD